MDVKIQGDMKKTVTSYMDMWLSFYKIETEGRKEVMVKINELFVVYDDIISCKVKDQWKQQRTSNKDV